MNAPVPFPEPNPDFRPECMPRTEAVLRKAVEERVFPCCAYGVVTAEGREANGAFGRFTWDKDEPEAQVESRFDIASLTKVVATTAMAMVLDQRGQLDLAQPVAELLPEFARARATGDPALAIRLEQLLAHSSGLPAHVEFFRSAQNAEELWQQLYRTPLEAAPGKRAVYSDLGFLLLGQALEAIAGESLASFCQREVFAPLGMTSTGFSPAKEECRGIPPTELDARTGRRIQGVVQDENARVLGGVAAHAGVFSNVPDLLRFGRALLSAGRIRSLFAAATVERFARRQEPEGSSRALGWDTPSGESSSGRFFSIKTIGHLGFSGCSLWVDLEAGVAAALLSNRTWPGRQNQGIRLLRPDFHDALRQELALSRDHR